MEALGEQLSTARRKLGLTPAEAALRLRIRTMFVEAMEREDWRAVGEPVYVRGFLRNYAKLLGLDPQPVLVRLESEYAFAAQPETTPALAREHTRPAAWYPWMLGALTVIAAILVVNVAIGLVSVVNYERTPQGVSVAPAQQDAAASVRSQPVESSNTLQAAAQNSSGGVDLRLQLTQPSWLSITVDGRRVVYETLPAGTVREFHGDHKISLRAGNAGGVVANFDGRDLGRLGHAGEVEDRVFAAKTTSGLFTRAHE